MTTRTPLVIVAGEVRQLSSTDALGGITGGTATGEVITQDQLGTNYNKLNTGGSPTFVGLTLTGDISVQGNTTIGDASGDTLTLNAAAVTVPTAVVVTKTAQAATAESILQFKVSDSATTLTIGNNTSNASQFAPVIDAVAEQGTSNTAFAFNATKGDSGTTNPNMLILGRYNSGSGNTDVPAACPILEIRNRATQGFFFTGGYNFQLLGTAPTLSALATDTISMAGVDALAGDRQLYARNEEGKANRLTGLSCEVTSDFTKTSDTTLANVTGLTRNVLAGEKYAFRAVLFTTSNSSGGIKFAIGGTATATRLFANARVFESSALKTVGTQRVSALAATFGDVTAVSAADVVIEGEIVVNAAGTLTVQFAQNASNGTGSVVKACSYFELISIGS